MIYLDYAATTPLDCEVEKAMQAFSRDNFANPSSSHHLGRVARTALEDARDRVASRLHAQSAEIIFTSGGTEADNLALFGVMHANKRAVKHIITTAFEHHAILSCCDRLQAEGIKVSYLLPDCSGRVSAAQVAEAMTDDTVMVSVMYANNEIGTIQPIADIGKLCRERNILLHCDAVQAAGDQSLHVEQLSVDLLALSAHKIYGPKGVGALYVRRGVRLQAMLFGGGQEHNRRAGSENVSGIIGFAQALDMVGDLSESNRLKTLRDQLIAGLLAIPDSRLNGGQIERLSNNVNVSFAGVPGEAFQQALDRAGISVSTGSACSAGNGQSSHVIRALGESLPKALEAVRFSLGRASCATDIEQTIAVSSKVVAQLRQRRSGR